MLSSPAATAESLNQEANDMGFELGFGIARAMIVVAGAYEMFESLMKLRHQQPYKSARIH
jgi:hypothetical protein